MKHSHVPEKTQNKPIRAHEKLKDLTIPNSTDNCLIIPCNPSGYGFILLQKDDDRMKDVIGPQINNTIRKLNRAIDVIIINKRAEERQEYNSKNIFIMKIILALGMITAYIMYSLALYDVKDFKTSGIYAPLGILMVLIVTSLIFLFMGLKVERNLIDLDSEIDKMLKREIEKENHSIYQQRGYILEKGTNFCWLSLKKTF